MYNDRINQYENLSRRMPNSIRTAMQVKQQAVEGDAGMMMKNDNPRTKETQNNGCKSTGWGLYEYPLAMAYAPYQNWRNIYKEDTALQRGTIFSELDLPFEGKNCRKG